MDEDKAYRLASGVNYSSLKHLRKSALHYRHAIEAGDDPKLAQKLAMFRAVHSLVLEPFGFETEYAIYLGRRDKRSKAYKEFLAKNEGKTILSPDEYEQAMACAASVNDHPWVQELLADPRTETEVPMFWEDGDVGTMKGKADILHLSPDRGLIVADLKTFATTDADQIARQGGINGWHIQMAHYLQGAAKHYGCDLATVKHSAFCVVVEAKAPHDCTVCQWGETTLEAAHLEHRALLLRLRTCLETDKWIGRPPLQTIDLPPYLL